MLIGVGSTNPVKLKAVETAFFKVWPKRKWLVKGLEVNSGVSNQPKSNEETIKGAKNRAFKVLSKLKPDFAVGLEGGLEEVGGEWFDRGWCVVIDSKRVIGIGSSAAVHVPQVMLKYILEGKELGWVDDLFSQKKDTKKNEGHFGLMTKNHLTRTQVYIEAVISALARFITPQFYRL